MSGTLKDFKNELTEVCEKYKRDPSSVKLVAVSKLQPIEKMKAAYEAGQKDFGENYVQEALEKQNELPARDIRWHLIGPIQKNKINKVIGAFYLIHSVDSLETAIEINSRAEKKNVIQPILLQLNLSGESTKSGQTAEDLKKNWEAYKKLKNLEIRGLMTMPPVDDSRPYFKNLRKLAEEFKLPELSMGTSGDWKEAIQEGATYIRIGTAVFGERIN